MQHLRYSQKSLEESKERTEELNQQLLQQTQKLNTKQRLSDALICNVFPSSISQSLMDIFDKAAEDCPEDSQRSPFRRDLVDYNQPSPFKTGPSFSLQESPAWAGLGPSVTLDRLSTLQEIVHDECSSASERSSVDIPRTTASFQDSSSPRARVLNFVGHSLAPKEHVATILFADLVGFTVVAAMQDPAVLVRFLDVFFGRVDDICKNEDVEKIKTIGDCYMCVAWDEGDPPVIAATRVLSVAEQIHRIIHDTPLCGRRLHIRAGAHRGSVVSGIIGKMKFAFDIWGDAVNIASRMENTGMPGRTQISADLYAVVPDKAMFMSRGLVDIKGKGQLETYINVMPARFSTMDRHTAGYEYHLQPSNAARILADLMVQTQTTE